MNNLKDIPKQHHEELAELLVGGEEILWWNKPEPFSSGKKPFLISGLLLIVCATVLVILKGVSMSFLSFFSLILLLFGFGLIILPSSVNRKSFRTLYLVTNQKVIILGQHSPWGSTHLYDINENLVQKMGVGETADGVGVIQFPNKIPLDTRTFIGFEKIKNVGEVEALIRGVASGGRSA